MLFASKEKIIGSCAYRHSQQNPQMFDEAFRDTICDLELIKNYAIFGDFNIDYAKFNLNSKLNNYGKNIMNLGCEQLITCPIIISLSRETNLSHVYINNCLVSKLRAVRSFNSSFRTTYSSEKLTVTASAHSSYS